MAVHTKYCRKAVSGLILTLLTTVPVFAGDQEGSVCIDISASPSAIRVLELIPTPVGNTGYYSLAGTHKNQAGVAVGLATGTALLRSDELVVTVNASSAASANAMEATLYQFNFDTSTAEAPSKGPFQSIIQQSSTGSSSPAVHKIGQAALVLCTDPLTEFSGTVTPPLPAGCKDDDGDGDIWCFLAQAGTNDCNDTNAAIYAGAAEICGDDVDQNCDGVVDEGCDNIDKDVDNDGYPSATDCRDNDASIHPGATEICGNGIDEDCNGRDLACTNTSTDADGDGYTTVNDCKDNNAAIHPGATEICGNGIDEDCSGSDLACSYASFTVRTADTLAQVGTNLIWQRQYYVPAASIGQINWISATRYCDNLNLASASNWRLPTKAELLAIVDPRQANPSTLAVEPLINPLFTGATATPYWTSTIDPARPDSYVYDVDFASGESRLRHQQTTTPKAMCVHN